MISGDGADRMVQCDHRLGKRLRCPDYAVRDSNWVEFPGSGVGRETHTIRAGSRPTTIAARTAHAGASTVGMSSAKAAIAPSIQPVTNQRMVAVIRLVVMSRL
jgi:hypothetical protein